MHHPTDRITHTTAFVAPVVEHWLEREIAQWVQPMKDRSDDPSHHVVCKHAGISLVTALDKCAYIFETHVSSHAYTQKQADRYIDR